MFVSGAGCTDATAPFTSCSGVRSMKTGFGRALTALLLLSLLSLAARAEQGGFACDRLVATGNPDYPPYLWRSQADETALVGANTLLLEEVGRRLGVPIEVIYTGSWSRAQEEVRAGRVDLIAGAFFTLPRVGYMDYIHPPFYTTRSLVWTRQDTTLDYQDWADLARWHGITVINNSFGQDFDAFARDNLRLETVATLDQAMRMLAQGRVDYLLYEEFPAEAYAEQLRLNDELRSLEPPISREQLFLTLSHRSNCNTGALRGELTRILAEMTADGTADRLLATGLLAWHERQSAN